MARKKRYTQAQDERADRRAGIREGSSRDQRVDKARGLPADSPFARDRSGGTRQRVNQDVRRRTAKKKRGK